MKNDKKILGFNCEVELANLIAARAMDEGKTTSEYVRDVLYRDLEGYEEPNLKEKVCPEA